MKNPDLITLTPEKIIHVLFKFLILVLPAYERKHRVSQCTETAPCFSRILASELLVDQSVGVVAESHLIYFIFLSLFILKANADKGVTFLLLGATIGVLGVLIVVVIRLCLLHRRPVKDRDGQQLTGRRCNGDRYSPVPADSGIDGPASIAPVVPSPPSGPQTVRSCSQLSVHWVRSESDRDAITSGSGRNAGCNGRPRNNRIVGRNGGCLGVRRMQTL